MKRLLPVITLLIIFWWVYDDAVAKVFYAEADDESFYLWYAYQEYYALLLYLSQMVTSQYVLFQKAM